MKTQILNKQQLHQQELKEGILSKITKKKKLYRVNCLKSEKHFMTRSYGNMKKRKRETKSKEKLKMRTLIR